MEKGDRQGGRQVQGHERLRLDGDRYFRGRGTRSSHRYAVHELVGWAFFGPRPTGAHSMDHKDQVTVDANGCLSNAVSNLVDWADKKTQATTSRNGSRTSTQGKCVRVRVKATLVWRLRDWSKRRMQVRKV